MEEIWKEIVDDRLEVGRYCISNKGCVFDKRRNEVKAIQDNGFGYKKTAFSLPGKKLVNGYIHRLVAIAFIPNPENLPQVGHKDHNKENNSVENLYWVTQSQNTKDGIEAGRINAKKRGKTNQLTQEQIEQIAQGKLNGTGVAEIARAMGLPRTTVSSVLNGRSHWDWFCHYIKVHSNPFSDDA